MDTAAIWAARACVYLGGRTPVRSRPSWTAEHPGGRVGRVKRPPPPLLALAAGFAQRALSKDAPPLTTARLLASTAVAGTSIALAGASARQFRRQGTTVDPLDPSRAGVLVTTGVNAITRNPMYVGMAGALVAHAIRRGSWAALLPGAAFVVVIDRFQIAAEEPALLANFGADYESYRQAVPRWLDARSVARALARG